MFSPFSLYFFTINPLVHTTPLELLLSFYPPPWEQVGASPPSRHRTWIRPDWRRWMCQLLWTLSSPGPCRGLNLHARKTSLIGGSTIEGKGPPLSLFSWIHCNWKSHLFILPFFLQSHGLRSDGKWMCFPMFMNFFLWFYFMDYAHYFWIILFYYLQIFLSVSHLLLIDV